MDTGVSACDDCFPIEADTPGCDSESFCTKLLYLYMHLLALSVSVRSPTAPKILPVSCFTARAQ